ncbi:MAG: rod shape-determining protein MreC [Immundisolibacteraceae bacterium]|nr:rod shape-determining protein MreC [Immundisolibacteraceae bacterium]
MSTLFIRGPAITLRLLLLVGFSVAALVADQRYRALEGPRGLVLTLLAPMQAVADWPLGHWQRIEALIAARVTLIERNQQLQATNQQLAIQQQHFDTLVAENERLNALLGSVAISNLPVRYRLARIVQVALDPHFQQVQINLGSSDLVYLGQPVISSDGVFGQVVHLGRHTAQVLLITDSSHALPVINQRSGQRGVARGDGASGLLRLPFMPAHADIRQGDLLLSSGLGKRFPRGYPVAIVRSVVVPPGEKFAQVVAIPVAQPNQIQEVLLLWPEQSETDRVGDTNPARNSFDNNSAVLPRFQQIP